MSVSPRDSSDKALTDEVKSWKKDEFLNVTHNHAQHSVVIGSVHVTHPLGAVGSHRAAPGGRLLLQHSALVKGTDGRPEMVSCFLDGGGNQSRGRPHKLHTHTHNHANI